MAQVKVHVLKAVGGYLPGQEVDVDEEIAAQLCDGIKAMKSEEWSKKVASAKDPKNLTQKEALELGVKNVPQANADLDLLSKTESAALKGVPVASGEPLTVTGGVTPPSLVFPAMAQAAGHPTTQASDVKPLKHEAKKPEAKAPEAPKAAPKPEEKK